MAIIEQEDGDILADDRDGACPLLGSDGPSSRFGREQAQEAAIDDEADRHADAGGGETPVPAVELAERAAHERRQQAAQIDAHVISAVGIGLARVVVGIKAADLDRQAAG